MTLTLCFVPGATPDKWAARWRERQAEPISLVLIEESEQRRALDDDTADLVLARLPIDRDGLHCIPLYDERPVVVASREHPVAAYDEIALADLADEQFPLGVPAGLEPTAPQLSWPPMTAKDAVEVVAAGTGVVVLPQSLARLHHRKDVVAVDLLDHPATTIGLCWRIDRDDERHQTLVGIVRGRTARSSR